MPLASCFSGSARASIAPVDLKFAGTQTREIQNSLLASDRPFGSFPRLPPLRVSPTPPEVAFRWPAEAIAAADASPPESPCHRQISRTRHTSTADSRWLASHAPTSCPTDESQPRRATRIGLWSVMSCEYAAH